jgi:hypothetical protein
MRRALIALAFALAAAAETAAVACTCIMPPGDPAERQRLARETAERALALVEVEVLSGYDARRRRGERLRVRRTIAGKAPALVTAERRARPSSAACDLELRPGQRATILLYPPERRAAAGVYRVSESCTTYLLADAAFRAALVEAMRRPR